MVARRRARALRRRAARAAACSSTPSPTAALGRARACRTTRCRRRRTPGGPWSPTRRSRRRRSRRTSPLIALDRHPARPAHPEFAGGNTPTHPALPGRRPPRHGDRLGGGRAGQRRRHRRRVAERPRAQRRRCRDRRSRCADVGATASRARSTHGAAVINMSYGSRGALHAGVRGAPARGRARARAGRRGRQRVRRGQPARVPGLAAARADRRRGRHRTTGAACFSNANAAIDLAAPGVRIMTAVPPALDSDGDRDGYLRSERHELLGADGRRRRRLGARRAARPDAPTRSPRSSACRRATSAARAGSPTPASACCRSAPRARPQGRRRRDPLEPNDDIVVGRRPRVRHARPGSSSTAGKRAPGPRLLDAFEDPADVYRDPRAPAPARRRSRADPRRRSDDVALYVFPQRTPSGCAPSRSRRSAHAAAAGRSASCCATARAGARDVLRGGRRCSAARDLDAGYTLRVG